MRNFHEGAVRTAATNQSITLAIGVPGPVIVRFAAVKNSTTGSRNIPIYAVTLDAQYLAGVGAVAGQLDPGKAVPILGNGDTIQGGVREWIVFHGRFELGGASHLKAILFDITECVAGDTIDAVVGVE